MNLVRLIIYLLAAQVNVHRGTRGCRKNQQCWGGFDEDLVFCLLRLPVYGPQPGADDAELRRLAAGMKVGDDAGALKAVCHYRS